MIKSLRKTIILIIIILLIIASPCIMLWYLWPDILEGYQELYEILKQMFKEIWSK